MRKRTQVSAQHKVDVSVTREERRLGNVANPALSAQQVHQGQASAMAAAAGPSTLTKCRLQECCSMLSDQALGMHTTAADRRLPDVKLTVGRSPVGDGELFQQNLQGHTRTSWCGMQSRPFWGLAMRVTATSRCIEAAWLH